MTFSRPAYDLLFITWHWKAPYGELSLDIYLFVYLCNTILNTKLSAFHIKFEQTLLVSLKK